MKKLIALLIPSLLLAALIFFAFHYFTTARVEKGALQVTAEPDSKVYLDNSYLGQTPLCKCEAADMLPAGDYTIRLVPLDKELPEFQEKIAIADGVLTVVDRKFGKDSFSEGSVISLTALPDQKTSELLVVSFPKGAEISLDGTDLGKTPLSHKNPTESDHVLQISKRGYKDKSIRIRTPLGYKLTVAVYLSTSTDISSEEDSIASDSAQTTPAVSPTETQSSVTILDTPTGFLRVRSSNTLGSAEIGQVKPGETYALVSEETGWFQIALDDKTNGWISSQYAEKKE